MEPGFWIDSWERGQIGFHEARVNAVLTEHADELLRGAERVLVPMCGKSVDLRFLAERGVDTVGVELVEKAVDDFHREQGLDPERSQEGPFRVYRNPSLVLYQGDVFDLTPERVGTFDRVWDRAAMVALDEPRRARYVDTLKTLVRPGGRILLVALEYDPSVMDGPPWSVSRAEVEARYGASRVSLIERRELIDDEPRWRERGHQTFQSVAYWIDL